MRRALRWVKWIVLAMAVLAATLAVGVLAILRTDWLREQVRLRIVQEAEKATGGKVTLARFEFDAGALEAKVHGLELRGKEPASDPPLARVEKIQVKAKVISFLRKDAYLEGLIVEKPQIRILVFPDGSTNIPGPKVRNPQGPSVFERFVSLSARRFRLANGTFEYDNKRIPIDLQAENLAVEFGWEREGPRYRGEVSAAPFHLRWPKAAPLDFDVKVRLTMDKEGLQFQQADIRDGASWVQAAGWMKDYRAPKLDVDAKGEFAMKRYGPAFRLPISPEGTTAFQGKFTYADGLYLLAGKMNGRNLAVREAAWQVTQAQVTGDVRLQPDLVEVKNIYARAAGGVFQGSAEIRAWHEFALKGVVQDFSLDDLQAIERQSRPVAWSATASGPVELAGSFAQRGISGLRVATHLVLESGEGRIPLEGVLRTRYQAEGQLIAFDSSYLKTPSTRVDFTGALGGDLRVLLDTTDLNDVLPAMAMITTAPPRQLPMQLDGGTAHFEGSVSSPLGNPRIRGRVALKNAVIEKRKLDSISADMEAGAGDLILRRIRFLQGASVIEGNAKAELRNWRLMGESVVSADFELRQASIGELLKGREMAVNLEGSASGPIDIRGTLQDLRFQAGMTLNKVRVDKEPFERIRFDLSYGPESIEATNGAVEHAAGKGQFRAAYRHAPGEYDRGKLQYEVTVQNARLGVIEAVRRARSDLDGRGDVRLSGEATVADGQAVVDTINGSVGLLQVAVNKNILGSIVFEAKTEGRRISVNASGDLLKSPVRGHGQWQLTGDAAGLGEIDLGKIKLATVGEILKVFGKSGELPLDGQFTGGIVFSGALRKPQTLVARAHLTDVELRPKTQRQIGAQVVEDLTLRNNGPLVMEMDDKGFHVIQAQLTGKETNLSASGSILSGVRSAWNLAFKGALNLGIFENAVAGLRATGLAEVNATVRGTMEEPQLGGRAEVKNANVTHRDLPNSVDRLNGIVVFDRNRALLQNFSAQTGGGELKLSGFLTLGGAEEVVYRLNGQLERVRIRYPEGASTTVNASLSLTGTSDQSLLGGTVTVLRSGFTPRTDFGSLLLQPSKPVQAPTSSALLRGMQFDVRLLSAPNLQLETSLTSGVQADLDLRVRGSPSKPVLLGTVSVTQGELNFFGTTYTITRGTVSFFNAARIEPVLDLDFETVVRAVTVNMNVSGPVDKPNVTYRSDPPLQPSDIIALLAVGRTPTGSAVATQTNVASATSGFYAGTDTLLGQALSAGVGGRLQRFFGVSRVKIDPQLVGLDTTPQARLTIEQQISRDITLTYVTNLTGTLQQLVRLQWDLQKNWSIIGVRDENGVIGADVLYRKRFK
ncbi:MAG: translocation/assembly module TamB domain-containing protein [Bryobacterales bacterium]|nr:translocation/assembly module TamB domain-containing protein [Bryobacterales bacterium]